MKGEKTLIVLEALANATVGLADVLIVMASEPYGISGAKFDRALQARERKRERRAEITRRELQIRQRHYSMLSALKRDGLIETAGNDRRLLRITSKGERLLGKLRLRRAVELPPTHYESNGGNNLVIVAFDIPETERRKRVWLRSALRSMGLHMLQKSLWVGKVQISARFLDDMRKLDLAPHVEILAVTKTGSLHRLDE